METIAFFGGDARTRAAMDYLRRQGYRCVDYGVTDPNPDLDRMRDAAAAVFPLPCEKNGALNAPLLTDPPTAAQIWRRAPLDRDTPVYSGPIKDCPFRNFTDVSKVQEFKDRNAVSTAEGALALLIQNTPRTAAGMDCLIVGWGAVGKRLAQVLRGLGANVTVSARKETHREAIRRAGYRSGDTAQLDLTGYGAVINTVPAPVIGAAQLAQADHGVLLMELASAPGGFDPAALEQSGRQILRAPGLPGAVAPVTAGEDLAKTLIGLWRRSE